MCSFFSSPPQASTVAARDAQVNHAVQSYQPDARTTALVASPEGKHLFVGDRRGSLAVLNAKSGARLAGAQLYDQPILALAVSPTGNKVRSPNPTEP